MPDNDPNSDTMLDDDYADDAYNVFEDEDRGPDPNSGLLDETEDDSMSEMSEMLADTTLSGGNSDDTLDGYDSFVDDYTGESDQATESATSEASSGAAPSPSA